MKATKETQTITLGKIDYNRNGKKENLCNIEWELKESEKGFEFSASANIWNRIGTDTLCCGQCLGEVIKYFPNNEEANFIYNVWLNYHLNNCTPGTQEQEMAIYKWKWKLAGNKYDYTKACEYLKTIELYEVEVEELETTGGPYTGLYAYGTKWVRGDIPAVLIEKIKALYK